MFKLIKEDMTVQLEQKVYSRLSRHNRSIDMLDRGNVNKPARVITQMYAPVKGIMWCDRDPENTERAVNSVMNRVYSRFSAPVEIMQYLPNFMHHCRDTLNLIEEGVKSGRKVCLVNTDLAAYLQCRPLTCKPIFLKGLAAGASAFLAESVKEMYDEDQVCVINPSLKNVKASMGMTGKSRKIVEEYLENVVGLKREEILPRKELQVGKIEFVDESGKKYYIDEEDLDEDEKACGTKVKSTFGINAKAMMNWVEHLFDSIEYLQHPPIMFHHNFTILSALFYGLQYVEGLRHHFEHREMLDIKYKMRAARKRQSARYHQRKQAEAKDDE